MIPLFILAGIALNGQSRQFMDMFERETRSIRSNNSFANFRNVQKLSYFPDTLPAWFFTPPVSSSLNVYAIGISDPDMEKEKALEQALYRARTMAVILHKSELQYYKDIYTSHEENQTARGHRQRFDVYLRLTASRNVVCSQFTLVNQHYTRYNEAIVLIRFAPDKSREAQDLVARVSAVANIFMVEARIGDAFEPQKSFDLVAEITTEGQRPINAEFNMITRGNRRLTHSNFGGQMIDYPAFAYRYTNPSWQPHHIPLTSQFGLWSVYLSGLMEHISLNTQNSDVIIKNVSQQNPYENRRNLVREVAQETTKIKLVTMDFEHDHVTFDVNLFPLR